MVRPVRVGLGDRGETLGGLRAGFSHRDMLSRTPLIIRTVDGSAWFGFAQWAATAIVFKTLLKLLVLPPC